VLRTLLQEHLAAAIEHEHVHGSMAEAEAMHFGAGRAANDFIALVDHVKEFVGALRVNHAVKIRASGTSFKRGKWALGCGRLTT
jgi:hypothetical protein